MPAPIARKKRAAAAPQAAQSHPAPGPPRRPEPGACSWHGGASAAAPPCLAAARVGRVRAGRTPRACACAHGRAQQPPTPVQRRLLARRPPGSRARAARGRRDARPCARPPSCVCPRLLPPHCSTALQSRLPLIPQPSLLPAAKVHAGRIAASLPLQAPPRAAGWGPAAGWLRSRGRRRRRLRSAAAQRHEGGAAARQPLGRAGAAGNAAAPHAGQGGNGDRWEAGARPARLGGRREGARAAPQCGARAGADGRASGEERAQPRSLARAALERARRAAVDVAAGDGPAGCAEAAQVGVGHAWGGGGRGGDGSGGVAAAPSGLAAAGACASARGSGRAKVAGRGAAARARARAARSGPPRARPAPRASHLRRRARAPGAAPRPPRAPRGRPPLQARGRPGGPRGATG